MQWFRLNQDIYILYTIQFYALFRYFMSFIGTPQPPSSMVGFYKEKAKVDMKIM